MEKPYFLLLCTFLLLSCSDSTNQAPPVEELDLGGSYRLDGDISSPLNVDEKAWTFITAIDTISINKVPGGRALINFYEIGCFVAEGDSALVKISVTGQGKYNKSFRKLWNARRNKWLHVYTITFNEVEGVDCKVSAETKILGTGESRITVTSVKILNTINRFDLFKADFGDSQTKTVNNFNMTAGTSTIRSISPNTLIIDGNYYSFKNDALTQLCILTGSDAVWLSKKYGRRNNSELLIGDQWTIGDLKFSYKKMELENPLSQFKVYDCIVASK